ncbi:hypothetical protein HanHA300_Chr02g0066401 [Helianthus annuus]|nr:hypothetical protein HanHA300_Chr02g0066401 [Helianthus annuus]KAJ0952852.1 hypothetical protein HanPSC8_Chr02g0077141 [Helianthus annuus]
MPQFRSGARRSKRLGDLQPATQPIVQTENVTAPTRGRRKTGGGRGRGNAAGVTKGLVTAIPGRLTAGGRGRGGRLIDLDQEPPCDIVPDPAVLGVREPGLNRIDAVADKDIAMDGGIADKIMGVEEDGNTPERVNK